MGNQPVALQGRYQRFNGAVYQRGIGHRQIEELKNEHRGVETISFLWTVVIRARRRNSYSPRSNPSECRMSRGLSGFYCMSRNRAAG